MKRNNIAAFAAGFSGILLGSFMTLYLLHTGFLVSAESGKEHKIGNTDFSNIIREVSAEALPVVVEIDVIETEKEADAGGIPWDNFFNNENGGRSASLGSGVIVRKTGKTYYVITNEHVIQSAQDIEVLCFDGKRYPGKLVGKDKRKDIALVSFETEDVQPVARLGDSDDLYVGDWVLAIGSPLGFKSSVTAGIVSALGRRNGPDGNINDFIQTDAAINQGNSGGALVNLAGEIIGINTWISTYNGGNVGLGFSIPINNIKKSIDQFIDDGTPKYGWLGVTISDLNPLLSKELGFDNYQGVFILQVFKDSPADKGGLRAGDLILKVNGKAPGDSAALTYRIGDYDPGTKLTFEIYRFGRKKTAQVTIAERTKETSASIDVIGIWPGIIPAPLTDDVKKTLKIPEEQKGILVETIYPKTPFQLGGLAAGDIIVRINDDTILTLVDFYKMINTGRTSTFEVEYIRDGKIMKSDKVSR
jgi:Do/DeqQ family serine protease